MRALEGSGDAGLRLFEQAVAACRIYPKGSQAPLSRLEAFCAWLRSVSSSDLAFDVLPDGLVVDGDECVSATGATQVGQRLHRYRVRRLEVGPQVSDTEIAELVDLLALPLRQIGTSPPLHEMIHGGHIVVLALEVEAAHTADGEIVEAGDGWASMVLSFVQNAGIDWGEIACSPAEMRQLLRWALEEAPGEGLGPPTQTIAGACRGAVELNGGVAGMENLPHALASMADEIDPEAWLELLGDPELLASVPAADGSNLAEATARLFSQAQMLNLVRYGLASRGSATPRLYEFLGRAVGSRPDSAELSRTVCPSQGDGTTARFEKAWPNLAEIMMGEDSSPWTPSEYEATLQSGTRAEDLMAPAERMRVRHRFRELDESFVAVRKLRIVVSLLQRETDTEMYVGLARCLEDGLGLLIQHSEPSVLEEGLSTCHRHANTESRPSAQRAAASSVLKTFDKPGRTSELYGLLCNEHAADFHVVWRIVEHLGSRIVPDLLDTLERHGGRAYRRNLLRILSSMEDVAADDLCGRLQGASASLARDIVWLAAHLARDAFEPTLLLAIVHDMPEVRETAVEGLTKLNTETAYRALVAAMSDVSVRVQASAMRAIRQRLTRQPEEELLGQLAARNLTGSCNASLLVAIKVLAAVGTERAIPPLVRHTRNVWLWRRRREPVRCAAQAAIDAIRARCEVPSVPPGSLEELDAAA